MINILDINIVFQLSEYEITDKFVDEYILYCNAGSYEGYNRDIKINTINTFDKENMMIVVDNVDKIYKIFEDNKEYIINQMVENLKERIKDFKEEIKRTVNDE